MLRYVALVAVIAAHAAAAAPSDDTCTNLAKVVDAATGKFKSLRGPELKPDIYASVVSLGGACGIETSSDEARSAVYSCTVDKAGDAQKYDAFVDKVKSCVDVRHEWKVTRASTRTIFEPADFFKPVVMVELKKNVVTLDVRAAPPAATVDKQQLCGQLDGLLKKADVAALSGTSKCAADAQGLSCVVYDGKDEPIADTSFRYMTNMIASCISPAVWQASVDGGAGWSRVTFKNPAPDAPQLVVERRDAAVHVNIKRAAAPSAP